MSPSSPSTIRLRGPLPSGQWRTFTRLPEMGWHALAALVRGRPATRIALLPGRAAVACGSRRLEVARGEGLAGALAALNEALTRVSVKGRAEVVLSHHFVHLGLMPPPPVPLGHNEMAMWLREQLARRYGPEASEWSLRWQPEPPGRPCVYALMEPSLEPQLRALLAARQVRLAGLNPWLADVVRRRRRMWAQAEAWLALAEPGRLTLARVAGGRWQCLESRRLAQEGPEELALGLVRTATRASVAAAGPVWLEGAGSGVGWSSLPPPFQLMHRPAPADAGVALQMLG